MQLQSHPLPRRLPPRPRLLRFRQSNPLPPPFPPPAISNNLPLQSGSCQCTQCRRQTGSLFFFSHRIPQRANFRFTTTPTSTPPATLKIYRASAHGERGFCGECGCFLFWRLLDDGTPETDYTAIAVGSVDPLYLFGEGADGFEVPEGGFGIALANGGGEHSWCANEMKGVTDGMEVLGRGRGLRRQGD